MAPVLAWFRLDARRRWRSLLVLALLIALSAGTVMTAVAGAKRGATSVDRLLEQTWPATLAVLPNQPGFDWELVRAMPEVEALAPIVISGYKTDGRAVGTTFMPAPGDAALMSTIERPVVLEGRLADPARPDETVVTPAFAATYGKGVGDTVTFELFTPGQVDAGQSYEDVPAGGPAVDATIVGIVRSWWIGDYVGDPGNAIPSAAVFAEHEDNFLGAEREWAFVNALVRLHGGEAAIPGFLAELAQVGGPDIEIWNLLEQAGEADRVLGFEANNLFVFAAVAALAALFLVGQAIARFSVSTVADLDMLRALGLSPRQSLTASMLGPVLAAVAGAAVGGAGAALASQWFPIGSAAFFEPAPGIAVDWQVLAIGLVGVPMLVGGGAATAAWYALRMTRRHGSVRRSSVALAVARAGLPVPVVVGSRFALEPGRGRTSVPIRPAMLGAITGVLGVVAAFTFSSGVNDALANPQRWGLVHDLEMGVASDIASPEGVLEAVAQVPGVSGVNDTHVGVADSGGTAITVMTIDPVGTPIEFVMTEGRLAEEPAEISLGIHSAQALQVGVGDTVRVAGPQGEAELAVVGVGFVPHMTHNDRISGALVTVAAYDSLFDADRARGGLVALEPGVEPEGVLPALYEAAASVPGGEDVWIYPAELLPEDVGQLQQGRALPIFLAGFLAVLALGAVGHALATAVRRRRHDVAVLRAVGMTRWQSRGVVVTQATVLALLGLVVGVPLGVALGRTVWRYVAETTPVLYLPPVAWLAVLVVIPAVLLAANLVAAWPGHRAASMHVGHVLRAE